MLFVCPVNAPQRMPCATTYAFVAFFFCVLVTLLTFCLLFVSLETDNLLLRLQFGLDVNRICKFFSQQNGQPFMASCTGSTSLGNGMGFQAHVGWSHRWVWVGIFEPLVYPYPQQGLVGLDGSSNSDETNTFQHGLWHVTTTLFSQPPQPSMIGHEEPPPWLRNGDDCPPMFMGAQHHHRCMAMIALHNLWQLATRTHHCDDRQAPTNSYKGPHHDQWLTMPPWLMNGHEGPSTLTTRA